MVLFTMNVIWQQIRQQKVWKLLSPGKPEQHANVPSTPSPAPQLRPKVLKTSTPPPNITHTHMCPQAPCDVDHRLLAPGSPFRYHPYAIPYDQTPHLTPITALA
eukprot:363664-Chlamydomonas_euryale.AAC.3